MADNYYSGNHLNRLSYLRSSQSFLASALSSPKARFILFNKLNPLAQPKDGHIRLQTIPYSEVKPYLADPSQIFRHVDEKDISSSSSPTAIEEKLATITYPTLVFLGVDERSAPEAIKSLPLSKPTPESTLETHAPHGNPIWALDVTQLDVLRKKFTIDGAEFVDMRAGMAAIPNEEAALAAEGRALIDWNTRNVYCPACARKTRSVWAGWKRSCVDSDTAEVCSSKSGVQNYNYPRTDPVCIMIVLNPAQDSILLGRQKRWPAKFYSALAGFIEPGESIEEAVRREIYEEAGIVCDQVYYHSSQPWPYPSSLMIGCVAVAKEGQTIRCDLDNELEDAHYFDRASVLAVLNGAKPSHLTREEVKRIDGKEGITEAVAGQTQNKSISRKDENGIEFFRLPPETAIAHTLVSAWANRTWINPSSYVE